jgi:hypothetical protein
MGTTGKRGGALGHGCTGEMTLREIAEHMDLPLSSVNFYLSKACRKMLRKMYPEHVRTFTEMEMTEVAARFRPHWDQIMMDYAYSSKKR